MNVILFDDEKRSDLLPLAYTRPCGDLRVGILTIAEKWKKYLNANISFLTQHYLATQFSTHYTDDNIYINGRVLPDEKFLEQVSGLEQNQAVEKEGKLVAFRSPKKFYINEININELSTLQYTNDLSIVYYTYDIFKLNGVEIKKDYKLLTKDRQSYKASHTNTLIGGDIFIEEGVEIEAAILNAKNGPIYIGKNTTVMEGALIKGPFALCESATVKMGAKIYGDTTIGPQCKVGGEVSNAVFYARSNKGHDGFLGNSVIGEWCNLGADTNSSNLKNNYAEVKLWNYTSKRFIKTGLQFCGLIMGDHSKCGINTMFNTGTVVGVSANIFGAAFPRNFIPSFTWGGATGFATYAPNKAFETARIVMERRQQELTEIDKEILMTIHSDSAEHRIWENKPLNT